MSNIYFTSDTHFGHDNIAGKNVSKWKGGYRHYNNTYEMNADIVKTFNKVVGEDDVLYHLGDWSFGGIDNIWNFRKQLRCKNIHLILGNHDHHIAENKVLPNVVKEPVGGEWVFIDTNHSPLGSNHDHIYEVKAQDLFKSVSYVKMVKFPNSIIFMSHYAHRVWEGSHKGIIHLYGHSHGTLEGVEEEKPWGKSKDVGIDVAIRQFGNIPRPFHLNEIVTEMNKRQVKFIDHHDKDTNI
jgi:calcineurin-like phosphoesterase family protein